MSFAAKLWVQNVYTGGKVPLKMHTQTHTQMHYIRGTCFEKKSESGKSAFKNVFIRRNSDWNDFLKNGKLMWRTEQIGKMGNQM